MRETVELHSTLVDRTRSDVSATEIELHTKVLRYTDNGTVF